MIFLWLRCKHPLLIIFLLALYLLIAIRFWYVAIPATALVLAFVITRHRKHTTERVAGAKTLAQLYELSPEHFEQTVLQILKSNGWHSLRWVGGSRDHGADITGVDPEGRFAVVQAKRYRPDIVIGAPVVRSLLGAREIYNADHCVLVTTAGFTSNATALASAMDVDLIGGVDLVGMTQRDATIGG